MENFIVINTATTVTGTWETIFLTLLIGGAALGIVAGIFALLEKWEVGAFVLWCVALSMMLASLVALLCCPKTIEHKVALKEGVTIEQIAEDYEIVDGNGTIFVIREKGE